MPGFYTRLEYSCGMYVKAHAHESKLSESGYSLRGVHFRSLWLNFSALELSPPTAYAFSSTKQTLFLRSRPSFMTGNVFH